MPIAIKAENISKAYQLGTIGTGTLTNDFQRWLAKVQGKEDPYLKIGETNDRTVKGGSDIVWSLKDISFEIEQGDAVGIIGANGAGKSTLLKILSKVTSPTQGKITGAGRIASLLEVGTGFHPELTGKENIYLNGAILGMRKREITKKFDEIVAFSGVERYIDTPVKRYSSGMYVRLAFSVAAHLDSEILIVDEVLAVGDAEFQKKCLEKLGAVSRGEGRTILFVSHNMDSVLNLCNYAIMLKNGTVQQIGTSRECIGLYRNSNINGINADWVNEFILTTPHLVAASLTTVGEQPNLKLRINFSVNGTGDDPAFVAFDITNNVNVPIMQALPALEPFIVFDGTIREYHVEIDVVGLVPDKYYVSIWIGSHNTHTFDTQSNILSFQIAESPTPGRTFPHTPEHGFIVPYSNIIP